ncbi:hypothetical protein [Flavobacterium sp.]|uniref:hypothetical protein n=1 Tax=Flavobacterium sp. TaxID=239 RepID=UPI00261458F3|nr:hypothetical protein [Flavobacterium sp.]
MRKFILVLLLFNGIVTNAQPTPQEAQALTTAEVDRAAQLYSELLSSRTSQEKDKAGMELLTRLNRKDVPTALINEQEWHDWVAKNLFSTKFKSVAEADALRAENLRLTKQLVLENKEFFDLVAKASQAQIVQIMGKRKFALPDVK